MSYSAVIFDLFGTLVPDIAGYPYERVATQMAEVLSVPSEKFIELWFGLVYERNIGVFETIQDNIMHICKKFKVDVSEDQVSRATRIRYEYVEQAMTSPRVYSLETITELRNRGVRIGLLSDCSPSEVDIWPLTPFSDMFDVTIFSSVVKLKKPDISIFQLAARRLQVHEKECIYVGNGGSNEIAGSHKSGMFPLLILPGNDARPDLYPEKEVIDYARKYGRVIKNHREILEFFE
ncbi:MAG: HAD family hydrolase [Dehalococcoidales bacterium]|nr:HAD family hydrolase [Dehalococcoidales bacterium]